MIQTSTRIAAEVVAGILAILVLLAVVAFWRLSQGPVQLDFLTPQIEQALADSDRGITVEIGHTELTWGGWDKTLNLHARGVKLRDRIGEPIAALPDVIIRLSLRALVQGTIAPTVVELVGARLSLVRAADGHFEFDFARGAEADEQEAKAEDVAAPDLSRVLPAVIEQLLSKPAAGQPLSFLTALRIVNGQVFIYDQKLRTVWEAPQADIELRRNAAGLAGDLAVEIELGENRAVLSGGFLYDRNTDRIDLNADFKGLQTEVMVSIAPQLAILSGLTSPLDGTLSASLGVDGLLDSLRLDATGGAGQLAVDGFLDDPLAVRDIKLVGRVSGPDRRFDIEEARLRLGEPDKPGPEISIAGSLVSTDREFSGDLTIDAEVTALNVPMAELERYWPAVAGGNERAWILGNVTRGMVDKAVAKTVLYVPAGAVEATEVRELTGALGYHGLDVHYLRPMPPVTGIDGTATFDKSRITFAPETGGLGELKIHPSKIDIFGLDAVDQSMAINMAIVGPLRASLELLDHEHLGLIRQLGMDPSTAGGQAAIRLDFRFPLLDALTYDQLAMAAKANLEDVSVNNFLFGQNATNGSLTLTLDKGGMQVKGPMELAGVPLDMDWDEAFTEGVPYKRKIEVQIARFDQAARKTFDLDFAPFLEGPVSASVLYTADHAGGARVKTAINLQDAQLTFAPLVWEKPPGVRGEAYLTFELFDNKLAELSNIDMTAGTFRAVGKGVFDQTGQGLAALDLDGLAFDNTSFTDVAVRWRGDALELRVGGGVLDAVPFLASDETKAGPGAGAETGGETEKTGADDKQNFRPLTVSAPRIQAIYFGADRFLEDVSVNLVRDRHGWQRIGVKAAVPRALWGFTVEPKLKIGKVERNEEMVRGDGQGESEEQAAAQDGAEVAPQEELPPPPVQKTLDIDFRPKPSGGHSLLVKAEDMGAVLRALDYADTIHGGRLVIEGSSDGPFPSSRLDARIEAQSYVMVDAPVLARLLTVASLTGILDLLNGDGIGFERLVGDFTVQKGLLETDLIRAYGPAVGLTAKGKINFDEGQVDLRGTVVPAYTLNRILGEIPLLGYLLTGGKGQGLIAFTYGMSGDLADPKVSVNPLSALAPGFLRGLFSIGSGSTGDEDEARALPEREEP